MPAPAEQIRPIILLTGLSFLVLLGIVWLSPIEFTACSVDSFWCSNAYWLTESAGKYGTLVIVTVVGFLFSLRADTLKEKVASFFRSFVPLLIFLSVFAFINEHATKKLLVLPRPSHEFMLRNSGANLKLDSLYRLEKEQREKIFQQVLDNAPAAFKGIDKKVQAHWVEESGFSFPSGHSFNAFALASVLAFCIYNMRSFPQLRMLFILPFVWAISVAVSRVAIGAHSALDVSVGAALGSLVSLVVMYFNTTRKFIIHKHNDR